MYRKTHGVPTGGLLATARAALVAGLFGGTILLTAFTVHGAEPAYGAHGRSGDELIMYSLSTCGHCARKRALFRKNGIRFTEYFIDRDAAREKEVWEKLDRAGYTKNFIGTPTLDVYGVMLPNNPPLDEIEKTIDRHRRNEPRSADRPRHVE